VRTIKGVSYCALCGTTLDVVVGATVRAVIVGGSGRPTERIVEADGVEIHRCAVAAAVHPFDRAEPQPTQG
jgi:hypothetical protein